MATNELFEGFSEEQQAKYEQEAETLWGETVRESSRKWKAYSAAQKVQILAEGKVIYQDLIAHLDEAPDAPAVQALIGRWHQHLRNFYEPTVGILRGLGVAYNDHPEFNANFNKMHPKLAAFMRTAIDTYCERLEAGK
jgi:hypothetical protein